MEPISTGKCGEPKQKLFQESLNRFLPAQYHVSGFSPHGVPRRNHL